MAFMSMMGAESVAYHEANVMERADDHRGQALDYYGSRGETPLVWGGSGAVDLGLEGRVTSDQFHAMFGPGGACDPTTGERLVRTRRPGVELVVAAHKSVAELGVMGRADHTQKILDAERDATLSYLDRLFVQQGGRRGEEALPTRTGGLIWATTRHATSRAGDPNPHDHVLVANVVSMEDAIGGWKAAHTALLREHLHAATMFGRVAAAHVAVQLGYGIERDDGPSGKLGHWRIAGVPEEVMRTHSKRAAEIEAEMDRLGYSSYRAKGIVARDTRAAKSHQPPADLLRRWRSEAESVGWPVEDMARAIADEARLRERQHLAFQSAANAHGDALAPDGPLAARKVFARRHVVVAVASKLFGLDPSLLPKVVDRVLADPEAVALLPTDGARHRVWATATTIATEQAVAASVARQVARTDAPAVHEVVARMEIGNHFTVGQRAAVMGIATSGRGADLLVGVAGSGKTTALAAVRKAFESEGFEVIGTSTSGQAARTLATQAGIKPSRTLASLTWRLDHGTLELTDRHIVILDEASMSDDADLLRLLEAASEGRAKVVLVGDHRQLGAVGPGGGFEALVARYGAAVLVLDQNVRQHDPDDRAALVELRDGNVAAAVASYARRGCIDVAPTRASAIEATVKDWAADVAEGRDAVMLAWRRAHVADLNRMGREASRAMGRLGDDELVAPGGTPYAVGDRVVALAPAAGGAVVTSGTATVVAIDAERMSLAVRMDDGGAVHTLSDEEIDAHRLAHAFAITVHRSQGSTVDRAHVLEDGGGRELAYVKMSRARESTTVHAVADSVDQALEDLRREWAAEKRLRWAIDRTVPFTRGRGGSLRRLPDPLPDALRRGRLLAEQRALTAALPPDPTAAIRAAQGRLTELARRRDDLHEGRGAYARHPVAEARRDHESAQALVSRLEYNAADRRLSRRERREVAAELAEARPKLGLATRRVAALADPESSRIDAAEARTSRHLDQLRGIERERNDWFDRHPEAVRRLDHLAAEIEDVDRRTGLSRDLGNPAAELEAEVHWGAVARPIGRDRGLALER